ncbi:transcriptional regulator, AraC family [Cognatiyoonia koreensis]|uniref:Transcriptional regulator, AraC family n=1 Tax=Cognatiyoonia koreensis TaxID=364200 RepID=A0A1I0P173_9RHOB|nr:AraC family transcriptional regulator [Cognatiyoonia koreensis]SEW07791.1 transcriptional regulator, AraC family [Cognatiyoonia koreensis]
MTDGTEHQTSGLALVPIAQNPQMGRWRTEAMRSHATPRLLFIGKGHGRITVAGLTSGYGPNNLIFIPAHTMYGFDVGPTVFGQMLSIPGAMAPEWPDEAVHLRMRDVGAQKEFTMIMDGLERELNSEKSAHSRAALYHLGLLSVYFERQLTSRPEDRAIGHSETSAARLVAAYTDLIERDYRKQMSIAGYADSLGVTPTHLTRCCKRTCGKSALGLLADRVHYEACVLLRDTKRPVQDIAADLGFTSPAYFSRAFQARAGRSPSLFRKLGATMRR